MAVLRETRGPTVVAGAPGSLVGPAAWFGLAVVPLVALITTTLGSVAGLQTLAIAAVASGLGVFVTHGGRRLTGAGIYCLTAGLMTGGSCWYWASEAPTSTNRPSILVAALSIYVATALMYLIFWRRSVEALASGPTTRPPIPAEWARSIALVGLILFVAGALAKEAGVTLGTLAQSTAEVGVILFASSLLLSGGVRVVHSPFQAFAICVLLVVFYLVIFSGGGRLRLVTVAIAIAVAAQYRLRTPIKLLAVVALVPTILFFGSIGQSRVAATAVNSNYQASASGLGSLVNPLATYAQMIDQGITGGHGSTFASEAVVLIPRGMWPDKPVQFGQIMVQKLHPGLSSKSNLSIPALDEGEWFYNFSWLGLVLMIGVSGALLRWIDRRVHSVQSFQRCGQVYLFIFFAILVGSISDLAWGGLGTWEVRNAQRLLVLLPVLLWYSLPIGRTAVDRRAKSG